MRNIPLQLISNVNFPSLFASSKALTTDNSPCLAEYNRDSSASRPGSAFEDMINNFFVYDFTF